MTIGKSAAYLNKLSNLIIGAALEVHKQLGPGLLESAYEACLVYELTQAGLKIERQKTLPIIYKSNRIDCGYRLDIVVDDGIILELKSVDQILPVHKAQLMSYLKLSQLSLGLLINFNVTILKDGIIRLVNEFPE
ncbi:MAG: GxxExxY protein [Candidatus Neomarinimicrobiota bacterium]